MFTPHYKSVYPILASAAIVFSLIGGFALSDGNKPRATVALQDAIRQDERAPLTFTDDGKLIQPTGYRKWVYVGTPLTPNDMNDGKAAFPEFHSVYMDPESFSTYEDTGVYPDGTVLVKELVSVGSKKASSGKGYFMGEFIGLEVSIKDSKRFPDEPGNWAFFSFGHEYPLADQAKAQPTTNCSACHGNLAEDDYVFSQYYPVIRAAKHEVPGRGARR